MTSTLSFFTEQITITRWVLWAILIMLILYTIPPYATFFEDVFAEPAELVWAGGEKGVRQVPVFYVETVFCNGFNLDSKGCYDPQADVITIKDGYRDVWTPRGCTILQHEQTHAWGFYDEVSVGTLFSCDDPNEDLTAGQYDSKNFFHGNPHYIWQGYDKTPKNIKLYGVGEF